MHQADISHIGADHSAARQAGNELVVAQAQRQVQTFFDELKNGTSNYRTVASLDAQIAQEYRGRCVLELLQNAHDALAHADPDDARISFVLSTDPEPVLSVGNSGRPFRKEDFDGICQLAQSPKDPNESVGNKGLGFRSVLEVSSCPEIYSVAPVGTGTSFVFRFDPDVADHVETAAQEIERHGLGARSPFDQDRPLVDWSLEQLNLYRCHVFDAGIDAVCEARKFLSPYLFPLPIEGVRPPDVDELLRGGHATVVRLRLNGGRAGAHREAVQSVIDQLSKLDAKSTLFLHDLGTLVIDINGNRRILERMVDRHVGIAGPPRTRHQRVRVRSSGSTDDAAVTRQFHVWTRRFGGGDEPEETERIRAVVEHLPNRWPQLRQVTVGVAAEDAPDAEGGVFVIFLPTETETGTGAHVNAPFYGSLNRRKIDFDEPYNVLLLDFLSGLCLDVVTRLVTGPPEGWRARAVIDILSSTATAGGENWWFIAKLRDLASERGNALDAQSLILCEDGWRLPGEARVMPKVQDDDRIGAERWRDRAGFAVVSTELSGRLDATAELLEDLGGSPKPTHDEWRRTIERMATHVCNGVVDVTWDDFLISVHGCLPSDLASEPRVGAQDPLADAKFLPTQDGRPIAASETTLFFQPVRGADDAAHLVGEVPQALRPHVAFLHEDVRTQEGPLRRNTVVQKFLDGRFARTFRREDVLRHVVVPALPRLPVPYDSPEADECSEILAWTLKLLGEDEPEALLPLIGQLPVATHSGWRAMNTAEFGSGWPERSGDRVRALADELPDEAGRRLHQTALLPPNDPRWGTLVEGRGELFARAGVFDGLRLQPAPATPFGMSQDDRHLPNEPPATIPQTAWDDWRNAVRAEVVPGFVSWFDYKLSGVQLLPAIHHLGKLTRQGRSALSDLVLASFTQWGAGWESVTITKVAGTDWRTTITSPLKHWLTTLPWLTDGSAVEPLRRRWLVPESLLRGQRERYAHLDPLSLQLARRLNAEARLQNTVARLGLNVYPTENERTGPELLDTLAAAWSGGRVPAGRFDVFLGQVRDAWRHLDPDKGLPSTFLVRSGQRKLSTRASDELANVFLPDERGRARSLQEYGKPILELEVNDAQRVADALEAATQINRASRLKERFLIDGDPWTERVDGLPPLDETRYASWLPVTLLTIRAHGGTNPTGADTLPWREAADRLRRTHVLECDHIAVELNEGEHVVAESEPEAQWLPGDVLAVRRTVEASHGDLAPAVQALLDRQDLLKDLRLVLKALAGHVQPTPEQIAIALEQAEIDGQAFADVRNRWSGRISLIVDRLRPVLALLGVRNDGLEAATDIERLTEWLTINLPHRPVSDVLSAARRCRDDRAMGEAAWHILGDVAQLPAWNDAVATLGERYAPVENDSATEQTQVHLEESRPLLRALARHIAVSAGHPELFHRVEEVSQAPKADPDWSRRWWQVPFASVLDALRTGYAELPGIGEHLEVLEGVTTTDDLKASFQRHGVEIEPDPYEIASRNQEGFENMLVQVHDLHRTWMELGASAGTSPTDPASSAPLGATAYCRLWSNHELIEQSLRVIGDDEFSTACYGCMSLEAISQQLGLTPEAADARHRERREQEQEAERRRRTFEVAGTPFEVGTTSYGTLFGRLDKLPAPDGPRASNDDFTPLAKTRPSAGGSGSRDQDGPTPAPRRPPADLRDLTGIVGEIHAYRFLRTEFGTDVVRRDAWVSESRLKVLPLVEGEPNNTSDSLGFDFQFRHRRRKWQVEVKATIGDDSQFELGISEIKAANRFARERGGRWRILRVRHALSERPEFDWLPNPFEEGFRNHFRLHRGGMRVSYVPTRQAR